MIMRTIHLLFRLIKTKTITPRRLSGLSNIQNLERRRWKGIYPPTAGHKLIKDDNLLETVLEEMIKIGKASHGKDNFKENIEYGNQNERSSNENKHKCRKFNKKNEIKQIVALIAMIKSLKLKNFIVNEPCYPPKTDIKNRRADSASKFDEKLAEEHESYGTKVYQGRITSTTPAKQNALSEQRRQRTEVLKEQSVLNGGMIIKEKHQKTCYFNEYEEEDKNYELIKFRCIDKDDMNMYKQDSTSGVLNSKYNRILHMDNPST